MSSLAQRTVIQHGYNGAINTTSAEDLWTQGGAWAAPVAAVVHHIASASASDSAGQLGATSVQVYGLDTNFDQINEVVTLAGTTDVTTTNAYSRLTRMIVRSCSDGSAGQANVGAITATSSDAAGTVTCAIAAGNNQSRQAIYTVPRNTVGVIRRIHGGPGQAVATRINIRLWVRPQGEVWQLADAFASNGPLASVVYDNGFILPAYSDVKLDAIVGVNSSSAKGTMQIELGFNTEGFN